MIEIDVDLGQMLNIRLLLLFANDAAVLCIRIWNQEFIIGASKGMIGPSNPSFNDEASEQTDGTSRSTSQ
jgi:hypothetical protein